MSRAIPFAEGERDIAAPIRTYRQFTSGGGPAPTYNEQLAREAEQIAQRFCSNSLTPEDRKQNIFSLNKTSTTAAVNQWLNETDDSRFWQVWMGRLPKAEIGCAEAQCRNNKILICRPNSPGVDAPSGVSPLAGFVEPQAETDARGCAVRPSFVTKTKEMYNKSLFRVLVAEAINEWLDDLANTLVQAERRMPLAEKVVIRLEQIDAKKNLPIPEAFIEPLSDKNRAKFLQEALNIAYEMYFPNGPEAGDVALTLNETWLLARQTLNKVPLITPKGLNLIPDNIKEVQTFMEM